jgi:CoA:oxalate CoA-transferase
VGHPEWKADSRFADRYARVAHRAELRAALEEALQGKSAADWEELFTRGGVPAGPILNVPEIIQHPQITSRKLIRRFENTPGVGREVAVARLGFRLSREQPDVDRPPPTLGRDTDDILKAAGYSAKEIEDFRSARVI